MRPVAIRHGRVVDGTGRPGRIADVLVDGGRVVSVGTVPDCGDFEELDASGLLVTPGFVDIHNHGDYTLLRDGRAESALTQGVTTVVVGNCGFGCFPINELDLAAQAIYGFDGALHPEFDDAAGYAAALADARPAVNVHSLVPNGQLRLATGGSADAASERRRLLRHNLDQGALGYSVGLEYPAECETDEHEMVQLCREVARRDGLFAVHTRARDLATAPAVAEAIRVADASGVSLQISHLTPRGGDLEIEACFAVVDAALARGANLRFDMHTRSFATLNLGVLLPNEVRRLPAAEQRQTLRERSVRSAISQHLPPILAGVDWSQVELVTDDSRSGRSFVELADDRATSPLGFALDVLADADDEAMPPMITVTCYTDAQLKDTFAHPSAIPASDATVLCLDGPLGSHVFHGAYTWAGWYWHAMVSESRRLSAETAVQRLSADPAAAARLTGRGVLRTGASADLAVFDPGGFRSVGTRRQPNDVAVGMRHVLVNGAIALRDGQLTGARAGAVLW